MEQTRHIAGGVAMIDWFDDLKVGTRYRGSEAEVSRDDIKRFAAEFDPQPFHLNEADAEKTIFEGLASSATPVVDGWGSRFDRQVCRPCHGQWQSRYERGGEDRWQTVQARSRPQPRHDRSPSDDDLGNDSPHR